MSVVQASAETVPPSNCRLPGTAPLPSTFTPGVVKAAAHPEGLPPSGALQGASAPAAEPDFPAAGPKGLQRKSPSRILEARLGP